MQATLRKMRQPDFLRVFNSGSENPEYQIEDAYVFIVLSKIMIVQTFLFAVIDKSRIQHRLGLHYTGLIFIPD
jgi:hypothetical protein